jgi:hypothetical protein
VPLVVHGFSVFCRDGDPPLEDLAPVPHPLLFQIPTSLRVNLNMKDRTETLELRSLAPPFSLGAANREATFTLDGLLAEGTLVLEFLRGTW